MRKTILIGISGCGKTTLVQRLKGEELAYRKTQMVEHHLNFIDTPGEYLERRNMYRALIVTAADAEVIGLMQECGAENTWLPLAAAVLRAELRAARVRDRQQGGSRKKRRGYRLRTRNTAAGGGREGLHGVGQGRRGA